MSIAGLIVGLGNPGPRYEMTRHNLGFWFVDALAEKTKASPLPGDKFKCRLWKASLSGEEWLLAEPQTFMNLSGECVQPLAGWYRLAPDQIVVVHDELDLPVGRMKFKTGGGNAGHNGLKSITQRLGTPDFHRLRLGIGRPPHPEMDTVNWVLGRLSSDDLENLKLLLPAAFRVVEHVVAGDLTAAIRDANGFTIP